MIFFYRFRNVYILNILKSSPPYRVRDFEKKIRNFFLWFFAYFEKWGQCTEKQKIYSERAANFTKKMYLQDFAKFNSLA